MVMIMNEQVVWICLIGGLIPYFITRRQIRGKHVLEVRALFWSLQYSDQQWVVYIPFIKRLQRAIWNVIMRLQEDGDSQE